jgi:hypothetical protein
MVVALLPTVGVTRIPPELIVAGPVRDRVRAGAALHRSVVVVRVLVVVLAFVLYLSF